MKIDKMSEMKGGWFIGNFLPSVVKTTLYEVAYKEHKTGEECDAHYHAEAIEINYLISGKMKIQGIILETGDIFTIEKNEIADPVFLEDCKIITVKMPSVIGDKYICQKK